MTLAQTVGALAPALDIDVWCQDGEGDKARVIQANDWEKISSLELLRRLAPAYSEEDLSRCTKNFYDINELDGSLVGRASLAGSSIGGFGFDLGALIHKGLIMGRWSMSGILLSGNNADIARSQAQPICSADALKSWAEIIYSQPKNKFPPWSNNVFLSLGLAAAQMPVAELADECVTPEEIKTYLQQDGLEEIVIALESPDCPDSMSKADFDCFEFADDVIDARFHPRGRENFGLEGWINSLLPETKEHPRSALSAVKHSILQAWPNATLSVEERAVGVAGSEKITTRCWVFRKTSSQEK